MKIKTILLTLLLSFSFNLFASEEPKFTEIVISANAKTMYKPEKFQVRFKMYEKFKNKESLRNAMMHLTKITYNLPIFSKIKKESLEGSYDNSNMNVYTNCNKDHKDCNFELRASFSYITKNKDEILKNHVKLMKNGFLEYDINPIMEPSDKVIQKTIKKAMENGFMQLSGFYPNLHNKKVYKSKNEESKKYMIKSINGSGHFNYHNKNSRHMMMESTMDNSELNIKDNEYNYRMTIIYLVEI